jgi:hypothetical protein
MGGVFAVSLTMLVATPAQATNWNQCAIGAVDRDPSNWQPRVKSGGLAVLASGPMTSCDYYPFIVYQDTDRVNYACYVTNQYGNSFTYVRSPDGGRSGWLDNASLKDGGSAYGCTTITFP